MKKYKITVRKVEEGVWATSIKPTSIVSGAVLTDRGKIYLENSKTKEEAEQRAKSYLNKLSVMDYDIFYE